jgi:hypothetical protein
MVKMADTPSQKGNEIEHSNVGRMFTPKSLHESIASGTQLNLRQYRVILKVQTNGYTERDNPSQYSPSGRSKE